MLRPVLVHVVLRAQEAQERVGGDVFGYGDVRLDDHTYHHVALGDPRGTSSCSAADRPAARPW